MKPLLLLLSLLSLSFSEIYTLDDLADVYYDAESGKPVPADEIKKLSGQKIKIAGYMVPFNSIENLKEFMLMPASNGCNFCESPALEEVVYVRRKGKKKYKFKSEALVIEGTLWVNGAGDPPPNSTYETFLYALIDPQVKELEEGQLKIVQEITPRTILKQVSGLLRTKLIKSVRFEPVTPTEWSKKRQTLLQQYLSQPEDAQLLLSKFLPGNELANFSNSIQNALGNWTAAACNDEGTVIYYRDDLNLEKKEDQLQIALAVYDLLFHQELPLSEILLQQPTTWDETLARLSLILGLRQSFNQFYGSIGLIEERPVTDFQTPWKEFDASSSILKKVSSLLLIDNASFIKELYEGERYQPYTKAMKAPPISMAQIFTPSLYLEEENYKTAEVPSDLFELPTRITESDSRKNRLGPALIQILFPSLKQEDYVNDSVQFYSVEEKAAFQLAVIFKDEATAKAYSKAFVNEQVEILQKGKALLFKSLSL